MKAEDDKRDDGGPAFPGYDIYGDGKQHMAGHPHGGATLRDYFAAKAQAPLMSALPPMPNAIYSDVPDQYALVAREAYRYADAMLAARNK